MRKALCIVLIWAVTAFAGVDGKTYDMCLDGTAFRVSFRSGAAFVTSNGSEWIFQYSEPDPIGDIEGIPFYLDGDRLKLILATATGTETAYEPVFSLRHVASFPAYLWHGAVRGDDIFWGSYVIQSGDDPANPAATDKTATWQRYYKMSPPYTSYVSYKLTDSGNHESCKPFFYSGNQQLVITERGAVYAYGDNVNSTFVGDYRHYLLAVSAWNGVPWFAWNPATFTANNGNSGTQLWYWDGSKPVYSGVSILDIMTFHMVEYDGYLYLFGQHPDYDSGRVYRVNPDLSTQCLFSGGVGLHHAISYAGSLYAGAGSRHGGTASIYRLEGDTLCMVGAFPENVNNFGTFAQFQGYLFASGSRSGGSGVLMRLASYGWQVVFDESDFTRLKPTAGTGSGLIQPTGFMAVTDKLYLMLNDINGGRIGPSYLFSITAE